MIKKLFTILSVLYLTTIAAYSQQPITDLKPTVILLSLDGFRWDYIDKYKPPTLMKIAKDGVRAKWMIPSFPTKTFPNHYTIATGLYPENHGIVENNVWDFGVTFTMSKREEVQNGRWWLGEPIWVTAEKQNVRAGAYFFPGTETEISGIRPSIWKQYDGKVPNEERVDTVLSWFDMPSDKRPQIITMYFSDTDDAGHGFSPDSDETKQAVARVDASIARLISGLDARKVDEKVNIIVVSDHGMAAVDQKHAVLMDKYLDQSKTERILTTGEIWQIFPKAGEMENVMTGLANVEHSTCWRKGEVPVRLHYNSGPRVAPIICSSEEGYFMTTGERYEAQKKRDDFRQIKGAHGYDNKYQSMMATFVARGRAFKKGKIVKPFSNVEVYNVMCRILGLSPAKNDGNLRHVRGMMR